MSTTTAPIPDANCDLVMKGGITSGVVYPRMIKELSGRFRFKNIGGTSAGAIAAAACAAAEHRRLTQGDAGGFDALDTLPKELGAQVEGSEGSRLFHLFQPAKAVAKHFAVLVSMLNAPPLTATGRALIAMVRQFWGMGLLGLLLGLLLFTPVVVMAWPAATLLPAAAVALAIIAAWWLWAFFGLRRLESVKAQPLKMIGGWWLIGVAVTALALYLTVRQPDSLRLWGAAVAAGIAAPLTIALVLLLSGVRFAMTLVSGMHANGYGLCSGRTMAAEGDKKALPGLTDWLADYLDKLAGTQDADHPLSFGDLWGAPRNGILFDEVAPRERRINLEVMTTAISQYLCFAIPFRGDQALYYDLREIRSMFPARVADWIEAASKAEAARQRPGTERVVVGEGTAERTLLRLPGNANLPVVLAVRMSLSFPVLLSAVPLYAIDFTRKHNHRPEGVRTATRIWFSDGGIASNMPLHFFDAMLPQHPTFAVNLKEVHPDFPIQEPPSKANEDGRVYLANNNSGGTVRHWNAPDDRQPFGGLIDFLLSIVGTMQNWRDEILFPYPGYRDRIVQISQRKDEGGLNLNMPPANITNLSQAGLFAAERLCERFYPTQAPASNGWKNHQDIRLRAFLGALENMVVPMYAAPPDDTWNQVLAAVSPHTYSTGHGSNAQACLDDLLSMGTLLHPKSASLEDRAPSPRATMRMTPRI